MLRCVMWRWTLAWECLVHPPCKVAAVKGYLPTKASCNVLKPATQKSGECPWHFYRGRWQSSNKLSDAVGVCHWRSNLTLKLPHQTLTFTAAANLIKA